METGRAFLARELHGMALNQSVCLRNLIPGLAVIQSEAGERLLLVKSLKEPLHSAGIRYRKARIL